MKFEIYATVAQFENSTYKNYDYIWNKSHQEVGGLVKSYLQYRLSLTSVAAGDDV